MNIAIIGVGNVGKALSQASVHARHAVTLSSNKPEDAQRVARETGAHAARSNGEAVNGAEVVILAVPYAATAGIVKELGAKLKGKTVIDVSNRMDPHDPGKVVDGTSNAEAIQALIPEATVVKAFNTVFASHQANPVVNGIQLDGFVAGADGPAKSKVLDLVRSLGFRPINAGPLSMARALEAMGWLNISLNMRDNGSWQDGWKLVGPAA